MRVRDLAKILEHVDPDMEVIVTAPRGACQVAVVERRRARRDKYLVEVDGRRFKAGDQLPPFLCISGGALWYEQEIDFGLSGPFRDEAALIAALDSEIPEGDPARTRMSVVDDPPPYGASKVSGRWHRTGKVRLSEAGNEFVTWACRGRSVNPDWSDVPPTNGERCKTCFP